MPDPSFILDASVTLAWGLEDESNAYTDAVLDSLEVAEAIVPAVWPLEVGNGILVAERRRRIAHADAVQFLTLLQELPIVVQPEAPERMLGEITALARLRCFISEPSDADGTPLSYAGRNAATGGCSLRRANIPAAKEVDDLFLTAGEC